MKQSFIHIMTLFIRHQYFSDGLFKSISFSLAEDSQRFFHNSGILIKTFPGGFHILSSDAEFPGNVDAADSIQLFLNSSDPFFINYTELPPYNLADKLLYFNNISGIKKEGINGFVLHSENFAGESELVQPVYDQIVIPGFNSGDDYRFTNAAGNEIYSQNISPSIKNGSSFNIFNLQQGLILFHSKENDVKKYYHYSNAVWKKPFAVLEIFPGKLYHQFKENGKVEYVINFSNRKTIWKYFLVSPVYNKFNNLSIINKAKEQVFSSPEKQSVHPETDALVFESKNKIPLAEHTDEVFQLVDNYSAGNGKGKIVLKNLPGASAGQLYRSEPITNETFYSHIFI